MISKVYSKSNIITFGRNISNYEQKEFQRNIDNKKQNELNIITDTINNNMLDGLSKGKLFDKFAYIYEESDNNNNAKVLYKAAVEQKQNSNESLFELFKSYIALQKTYQATGELQKSEEIDAYLEKTAKENDCIKPKPLTQDEINTSNNLFIKNALIISEKLLMENKPQTALNIFNAAKKIITENNLESVYDNKSYKKLQAVLLQKNGFYDESSEIYKDLIDSDDSNQILDYKHKVVENNLSLNQTDKIYIDLDDCLDMAKSTKEILENLFLRANYEYQNNHLLNAAKYINLAAAVAQNSDEDVKYSINLLLALELKNNNQIEKSSDVCIKNLEALENRNKIFSEEFVKSLFILASNDYEEYKKDAKGDFDKLSAAIDTFKNAFKISDEIYDNESKIMIANEMANIYFEQGNEEKFKKFAKFILETDKENSLLSGNAYRLLALNSLKNNNLNDSINKFEKERKLLLANNADKCLIQENLKNLIEVHRKNGDIQKAEDYTKILADKKSARYTDLMELGNTNLRNAEYKKAQEYYEQAANLEGEAESLKAIALINVGTAKLQTQNDKKALKDIEKGVSDLERIIKNDNYSNDEETKTLLDSLNFLGEYYYLKKAEYNSAARIFEKMYTIQSKQISERLSDDFKNSVTTKTGAAFYKAGKYEKALPYYMEYLQKLTDIPKVNFSSINAEFTENIVDKKDRKECAQIAMTLEVIGVINVKDQRFMAANNCFECALKIRELAGGNNLLLANDYKALSRLAMLYTFENPKAGFGVSKQYLEKAIELMKSKLGNKADAVLKEQKFLDKYFGFNFNSIGKYGLRAWGRAKEFFGGKNNFKNEIIKDFHIIYEDLALCE